MKKLTPFLGALVIGCFVIVSCKPEAAPEAAPETEKEPLTLQDFAVDPSLEEAAANESEMIADSMRKRDEINEKTKASEENAEKLKGILEGN